MASDFAAALYRARFLFGTVPLFSLATTGLFPIVALELNARGVDERTVGAITSLYYLGAVLGAFSFGAVVARLGQRRALAVAAIIAAASTVLLGQTDDTGHWLALRFVTGYSLGAYYLVMDSWVASLATPSTRARLHAVYETTRLVATAAGPLALLIGTLQTNVWWLAAAFVLAVGPALLNRETAVAAGKSLTPAALIDTVRCFCWPMLVAICGGLANASFYALGAVYAQDVGYAPAMVAVFVSAVLFAPVLSELPIGALADRFTRMGVAAMAAGVAAVAATLMAVLGQPGLALALPLGVLVGGTMVTMYALALSRIVDAVGGENAVQAATVALLAYNVGSFIGPALSGAAVYRFGPAGLYLSICGFALATCAAALIDRHRARCCGELAGPAPVPVR